MDKQKQYFISIVSSFLNSDAPEIHDDIDWKEIYRLSVMHNVTAIIANQISKIPEHLKPAEPMMKAFRQQLGYTIISYENKCNIINRLRNLFNENGISFIFVKGAVLKDYYPVKELRTSGDIDIFIKFSDYERAKALFSKDKYRITANASGGFAFDCGDEHIELHTEMDYDNEFFSDIFNIADKKDGFEYSLSDHLHLLYVLCHIEKHFNYLGAGLRMFSDVDVLLRHMDHFDYQQFISLCEKASIATLAVSVFSFCNYRFNTPVKAEIDYNKDKNMLNLFENIIIDGGSFGFSQKNMGDYYINQSIGKSLKNNIFTKIKAILLFLFPKPSYFKHIYPYCLKHPVLIPLGWLQRLIGGLFKRTDHSKKTIKNIITSGNYSEEYKKLLKELGIYRS